VFVSSFSLTQPWRRGRAINDNVLSYSQREAIVRGYASKAGFAVLPGLAAVRA
jgi:hypothetical protein